MKALQYLNKYFLKYKYRLLIGIIITILSNVLALQVPHFIRESVNVAEDYRNGIVTNIDTVKTDLLNNILFIIGAALLSGFFTFLMRQMIIVTSRLIEFDLKNEIYAQYQRLSLNFYKKNRTGDLMNRISEDVTKVRMYLGPAIMYSINVVVLFVMVITFMIYKNATLTMYVLFPLPVLSIIIYFVSSIINKKSEITQKKQSKIFMTILE